MSLWRVLLAVVTLALGAETLLARLGHQWWPAPLPPAAVPAALAWCGLAIALGLGVGGRRVTLPLSLCVLFAGELATWWRGHAVLIFLLVLAGSMPAAPYGSWPARGRVDPGGGWRLPPSSRRLAWLGVAAIWVWTIWQFAKPEFAGSRKGAWHLSEPIGPIVWHLTGPLALLHALAFKPAWLPAVGQRIRVVYYDGSCGLCHNAIRFLLAEDTSAQLRFAALQGDTFAASVPADVTVPDSVVVQLDDGTLLWKTAAARHLLGRLGGGWRAVGWLLRLIPLPLADVIYDAIARVRHRIFTRPKDVCPLLPPPLRARFLP